MKKLGLFLAASFVGLGVHGEILTPGEALQRIGNNNSGARRIAARLAIPDPTMTLLSDGQLPQLYVFTPSDGGLLLLSAESEAPAVLGYSETFTCTGSVADNLPPALMDMIDGYAIEIDAIRAGQAIGAPSRADGNDFAPVEPICATLWDQGAPYNETLPLYNGKAPYTGCTATAAAQVLKAYEYPAKCSGGTNSYSWNNTTISLNFDDVTLDWDNMLDKYNGNKDPEVNRLAVANLMKACGIACNTNFTTTASGAAAAAVAAGLINYFDYDYTAIYLLRSWFNLSKWQKMVYDEVAAGYPILYNGFNQKGGGHAFVVDGYKANGYFHLNWGWSGTSNGYFLLTALDPQTQGTGGSNAAYNLDQGAIFNVRPGKTTPASEIPLYFFGTGSFKPTQTLAKLGDAVTFIYADANGNSSFIYNRACRTVSNVRSAIKFTAADGTEYHGHCPFPQYPTIGYLSGMVAGPVTIPANLPEGTYVCSPEVWSADYDKYYPIYYPMSNSFTFEATVAGGQVSFGAQIVPSVTLKGLDVPKEIRTNEPFYVKGEISNTTDSDFEGPLCLGLYDSGKTIRKANIGEVCGRVESGKSVEFDSKMTLTVGTIVSGTYDLAFFDSKSNKIMSDPFPVQLIAPDDAAAIRVSKLTCVDPWKANLEFSLTVTASEGNFNGQIFIEIRKKGDSAAVDRFQSAPLKIAEKDSQSITVCDEFKDGVVGEQYTAYVFYTRAGQLVEAPGNQRCSFTLSDEASLSEVAADLNCQIAIYDLSGRRVARPVKGNIYIVNNQKIKF